MEEKKVVFVCTGNTCRSPMAEFIMKKEIEERGIAAGEYARALYFCGRPDLALQFAKEAVKLLKGTREAAQANALAVYLNTVILASKQLK